MDIPSFVLCGQCGTVVVLQDGRYWSQMDYSVGSAVRHWCSPIPVILLPEPPASVDKVADVSPHTEGQIDRASYLQLEDRWSQ